jgi:NAD(P)-dependent dehydrogenase (short-subunit alcohol dehydrogenase family)
LTRPLRSDYAQGHFGGIDVLVNNAGIDFIGAVEEHVAF